MVSRLTNPRFRFPSAGISLRARRTYLLAIRLTEGTNNFHERVSSLHDRSGWVLYRYRAFKCAEDAEALVWAKQLVDGYPIELWSGERFIARLELEGGVKPAPKSEPQSGPRGGKPPKRLGL